MHKLACSRLVESYTCVHGFFFLKSMFCMQIYEHVDSNALSLQEIAGDVNSFQLFLLLTDKQKIKVTSIFPNKEIYCISIYGLIC